MTHTPGPWINKHWTNNGTIEIAAVAYRGPNRMVNIGAVSVFDELVGWKCTAETVAETEGNARLIAAAPDLLVACQAALAWCEMSVKTRGGDILPDLAANNLREAAIPLRAAIVKATC